MFTRYAPTTINNNKNDRHEPINSPDDKQKTMIVPAREASAPSFTRLGPCIIAIFATLPLVNPSNAVSNHVTPSFLVIIGSRLPSMLLIQRNKGINKRTTAAPKTVVGVMI